MIRAAGLLATLLAPFLASPSGPARAAEGDAAIGTWRLTCAMDRMTDRTACTLLHQQPVERSEPGRPALALEVVDRGGRLVPVVALRNLSLESASRGLLALTGTVQLRFPPNPMMEMPCGLEGRSLVCAPRPADAARAEEELARADRVLLRLVGPGGGASTAEPTELRLSGTREAMARYREHMPPGAPQPEPPGLDAREMMLRLRQFFGF